jgi:hypothetical protein
MNKPTERRQGSGEPEDVKPEDAKLDERPEIWQKAGNLSRYAEATWIDIIAEANELIKDSLVRTILAFTRNPFLVALMLR